MTGLIWVASQRHYNSGIEKLKKIISDYEKLNIQLIPPLKISKYLTTAKFNNGDIWQVMIASSPNTIRGHRCNIAYIDYDIIDYDISNKIIEEVIKPIVILPPYQGINYFYTGDY